MVLKADQTVKVTKEGLEELKAEIAELTDVKIPKIIKRVAAAREQGDLSENADYQDARQEQGLLEARLAEIEDILDNAVVVKNTGSTTTIGMGSKIKIELAKKKGKVFSYTIGGEFESDPEEGKISSVSPLGKALIGKKKGDKVTVIAPAGEIEYIVKDIK